MRKVMIVDDEIIVRVGIQSCIHWEEQGFEICAVCESGKEAVAHFQKEVPDIVFTDIMMPEMNGIELVEYICTNYPKTKVVVLSCVNEIDYVKKAIKLGAEDYILKLSFTTASLIELLAKLRAAIEEENSTEESPDIYANIQAFNREEAFRTLIFGSLSTVESEAILDKLGYAYDPFEEYAIASILIERYGSKDAGNCDEDIMRYGLLNLIREYFEKLPEYELIFLKQNEMMAVFCQLPEPELCKEALYKLNHALRTHLNLTLSMGLNPETVGRTGIAASYKKAKKLAELQFFDGVGSYHDKEDLPEGGAAMKKGPQKELREAVFSQNGECTYELINQWFEDMTVVRNHERIMAIRRQVVETWIYLSGSAMPEQDNVPDYLNINSVSDMWRAETLETLKESFEYSVQVLMDWLQANKTTNPELARLLIYLEENISESLTLEQAAIQCNLGKSQFCILFKKATGETFINYVNQLKMKKAYELLCSENILVQEAANQIGIRDISYFSRLFKKYYNISPSEVRRL